MGMFRRPLIAATALALAAVGAAGASASPARAANGGQSNWTEVASSGPPAGAGDAMAYDQATSTDVLFTTGGQTWSFDGSTWTQLAPTTSPPPRSYAAMAYDQANGTVVLFGGQSGSTYLSDTWVWNGTTWSEQTTSTTNPPARAGASASWLAGFGGGDGEVMLFGGYDGTAYLADAWVWNGSSWSELEANYVAVGAGPSPRADAMMAADGSDGSIVLYGGQGPTGLLGDTWVFGTTNWTPSGTSGPAARSGGAMAYSPAAGEVLLFGGTNGSGYGADTWLWGGSGWSEEDDASAPPARTGAAMATDPAGGVVLFGGNGPAGGLGDTWAWLPPAPPQPASANRIGAGPFHTSGNQIIGPDGKPVIFKGVNAIGVDLVNNQGTVITSVAAMDRDIDALRAWGFNLVRFFVYDDLWLNAGTSHDCGSAPFFGRPGDNQGVPGNYQTWVRDAVNRITADGMAVELSLWEGDPPVNGVIPCTDNWAPMAEYPNALTFWSQVAKMFGGDPGVIFETYNEPDLTPPLPTDAQGDQTADPDSTWLNGGWMWGDDGCRDPAHPCYQIAGMQQIYDTIRATGATNLVFVTGETLGPTSGILGGGPYDSIKVALRDPVQGYNIVYATHIYLGGCGPDIVDTGVPQLDGLSTGNSTVDGFNPLDNDVDQSVLPVAAKYPVVLDEFGTVCTVDTAGEDYIANVVSFADEHHLGYAVFDWNPFRDPWGANGYGIFMNDTSYAPSPWGIPVFDDLRVRSQACALGALAEGPVGDATQSDGASPCPSGYLPALTSVSQPTVAISPTTAAGATGVDYTVQFNTSQEGLLGKGSWIRLSAPAGTSFYDVADPLVVDLTSHHQVSASCCDQVGRQWFDPSTARYGVAGAANVITIPLAGTVSPGDRVMVRLRGVANPGPGAGSITVSTSTDRRPATTPAYEITPPRSVSRVGLSLSNYTLGASGVTWTTTFTTSSTGAMGGTWPAGQITITAPTGTDLSASTGHTSLFDLTTATQVSGLSFSYPLGSLTFALLHALPAGDKLRLVVGDVTNPISGSYSVGVVTSSDTIEASCTIPGRGRPSHGRCRP